jgi:hypothetical protein
LVQLFWFLDTMLTAARLVCRGLCVAPAVPASGASRMGFLQFVSPTVRAMSQDVKGGFASRLTRRRGPTLKERAMAPATDTGMRFTNIFFIHTNVLIFAMFAAFNIGRIAVAGGSVFGIGALCYYGLGLSNEPGAIERARY